MTQLSKLHTAYTAEPPSVLQTLVTQKVTLSLRTAAIQIFHMTLVRKWFLWLAT